MLLLAGCNNSNDPLISALQNLGSPSGNQSAAAAPPANAVKPIAAAIPVVQNTGTAVGARTMTIRADLQRLSESIDRHNGEFQRVNDAYGGDRRAYTETVGATETHGTAPNSPALAAEKDRARRQLDRVAQDTAQLNAIASEVAGDVALSAYIDQEMKSAAAFEAGADDRRQLASLQTAAAADRVVAGRLKTVVDAELARQSANLGQERRRLAGLTAPAHGGGPAVASRPVASMPPAHRAPAVHAQRPLVIIRFDRPDVPYQQVLYTAVKRALERRPDATFDLVAVSPTSDDDRQLKTATDRAERDAQDVLRTLSSMGLSPERVRLSAMTSSEVATNQVQIFVR